MSRLVARHRFGAPIRTVAQAAFVPLALGLASAHVGYDWIQGRASSGLTQGYWSASLTSLLGNWEGDVPPEPPARADLLAEYRSLAYPGGGSAGTEQLIQLSEAERKHRHILIVSLETAPRKYYPILDNPEFPTFQRMSQRAIVSDAHYANTPFTAFANFSILSGTYPMPGKFIAMYGQFRADGLANVLGEHGYESTYIDSFQIDWQPGNKQRRTVESLGFGHLVDKRDLDGKGAREVEKRALEYARERLLQAHQRGRKAVIFVDTIRGHHPWKPRPGNPGGAAGVIAEITHEFDALFGSLLDFLELHELLDDTIIVVTGDHGLRMRDEFASLGEEMGHSDVAFNVPFLLYAPGLLETQVRLPHVTSHVDITPTLLDLVGISTESMVHHGESVLNERLRDRMVFLMNTKLIPLDGFHWNGYFFSYNELTSVARIATEPDRGDEKPFAHDLEPDPGIPKALQDPRQVLEAANRLFNLTAAYQLSWDGREPDRGASSAAR
jgi:arylsulfatase A-like enzyme